MQGAVYSLVSFFGESYMIATISGQSLGGIVAALAQLLALWWGASPVNSAFVYFLFADIFILISLLLYTFLVKTVSKFYYSYKLYELFQNFNFKIFYRIFINIMLKIYQLVLG